MRDALVDSHRWSRAEYDRAAAAGVFSADARLELIDGEILDMTPQGSRHATAFSLVAAAVQGAFGPGYYVRLQLPLGRLATTRNRSPMWQWWRAASATTVTRTRAPRC